MCGAQIDIRNNESSITCEFCGTNQTVPIISANNLKSSTLHNRANSLRLKGEFDQALLTYENIVIDNPTDAEAHWGIVLCRYGIEYVNDPKSGKKIPTCRRTELMSIFDDIDYKAAIENSDVVAKRMYQSEAEQINKIQKGILVISQSEKPFDIFISYKETDEFGKRTRDSVIAQEIYNELVEKKYRVFFSRITLESKLGSQYEPYIFSALNSSKVMLVVGTKASHVNSVWVKNEWSRFLSLINNNPQKKYIIPCYRDMDVYELPNELLTFQSQDMNKLGFIQDLIRGIDKLFNRQEAQVEYVKAQTSDLNNLRINTAALLKRSEILINDGEFSKAGLILDDLLNNEPENSKAYFLLLLVELKIKNIDDLKMFDKELSGYVNYERAIRYADSEYSNQLVDINKYIESRIEFERKSKIYEEATGYMNRREYDLAMELFSQLEDFQDSRKLVKVCEKFLEEHLAFEYESNLFRLRNDEFDIAIAGFEKIKHYRDSSDLIVIAKSNKRKESQYRRAIGLSNTTNIEMLHHANKLLYGITGYKKSENIINKNIAKIESLEIQKSKKNKRNLKILSVLSLITIVVIGLISVTMTVFVPLGKYNKAKKMLNDKQYDSARILFEELNGFKDSNVIIDFIPAYTFFDEDNYKAGVHVMLRNEGVARINYDPSGGVVSRSYDVFDFYNRLVDNDGFREGYSFIDWTIENYTIDLNTNNYTVNLSLSAKWSLLYYDISYVLNGGVSVDLPTNYTINDNILIPNPTKRGYSFIGWTEKHEDIAPADNYTIPSGSYGDKEFTAHWQPNLYKIHYDPNGGIVDQLIQDVLYDSNYVLLLPTRDAFIFDGWFLGGNIFNNGTFTFTNDVYLTAKWK